MGEQWMAAADCSAARPRSGGIRACGRTRQAWCRASKPVAAPLSCRAAPSAIVGAAIATARPLRHPVHARGGVANVGPRVCRAPATAQHTHKPNPASVGCRGWRTVRCLDTILARAPRRRLAAHGIAHDGRTARRSAAVAHCRGAGAAHPRWPAQAICRAAVRRGRRSPRSTARCSCRVLRRPSRAASCSGRRATADGGAPARRRQASGHDDSGSSADDGR